MVETCCRPFGFVVQDTIIWLSLIGTNENSTCNNLPTVRRWRRINAVGCLKNFEQSLCSYYFMCKINSEDLRSDSLRMSKRLVHKGRR